MTSRPALAIVAVVAVLLVTAVVFLGVRGSGEHDASGSAQPSRRATTLSRGPSPSVSPSTTAMFGDPPSAASGQPTDTSLTTPIRARYASFDDAILPTTAAGQQLTFAFFADATFTGTIRAVDQQPLFTSWSGPLDLPQSTFVITRTADRYQVTASTTRGSFTMNLTPQGFYQLAEVDQPTVLDDDGVVPSVVSQSP